MRRFHSYGPVDCERHFCVPRRELVEACLTHIVDDPEKGGHYFTIWAPRQSGKTWLMREVKKKIEACCPEQFQVGMNVNRSRSSRKTSFRSFLRDNA